MCKHLKTKICNETSGIPCCTTRRDFLKKAALTTGGIAVSLMANPLFPSKLYGEDIDPSRRIQIALAYETMLTGILFNRAILPQIILRTFNYDIMNEVAIDIWMGATPVYTPRMRSLMGIEGDTVTDIMKALQLDVGFVHQYMDVGYLVHDDYNGEFWLNHCGALLDAEPTGEDRVYDMCHPIEDVTFDATAVATNPRVRCLPIHRPPREPADRVPHCHWTLTIDDANEPLLPHALTEQVGKLMLAGVPNTLSVSSSPDGRIDYSGDFDPDFTLATLATETIQALQKEFAVQTHLLAAAAELSLAGHFNEDVVHRMMARAWAGLSWIMSERLASTLGLDDKPGASGIATVLAKHPLLPPGFSREITLESSNTVRITLTEEVPGLLDTTHPGVPGLLAREDQKGLEAMAQAVDPRARLIKLSAYGNQVTAVFKVYWWALPATQPAINLLIDSLASNWSFDI